MQCDHCDNKATVFYTQIIDGISKKSSLCQSCATKQGVTDPEGFLLGSKDTAASGKPTTPKAMPQLETTMGKKASRCCPGCGFAFDDLKKTGRLGCSECYEFFREEIKNNLGGMHKGTSHTGRVPEGMLKAFEHRRRMEQLQLDLDEAIQSEDYEKAAAMRDEINKLSEETSSPPEHSDQP
jgi:protein arginine kinase activator